MSSVTISCILKKKLGKNPLKKVRAIVGPYVWEWGDLEVVGYVQGESQC